MRATISLFAVALLISASTPASDLRTAERKLKKAIAWETLTVRQEKERAKRIEEALTYIVADNSVAAMKVLLRAVAANQKAPADLWQMLIMAPASITDPKAVMECAGWVINRKSKGMARDVLAMMTNQAHSSLVPAMIR